MTLFERMVEAGARAIYMRGLWTAKPQNQTDEEWFRSCITNDPDGWEEAQLDARACITAAFALAEGDGVILTVVPPRAVMPNHPLVQNVQGIGWNACRAAVLAGKVTP